MKEGPGEVYPLAVLVDVLYRAGKKAEAKAEFAKLARWRPTPTWTIPCSRG